MKKCLVVDDSLVTRLMLVEMLERLAPDFEVLQATCGQEAIDKVADLTEVEFALIDFNMPGMNGLELAEKLSVSGKINRMAMLTANIQNALKSKALEAGLQFINKPLNEQLISQFVNHSNNKH